MGPIALLIEEVLGIEVDAPTSTVRWRLCSRSEQGFSSLRFGDNVVSLSAQEADRGETTVQVTAHNAFLRVTSRIVMLVGMALGSQITASMGYMIAIPLVGLFFFTSAFLTMAVRIPMHSRKRTSVSFFDDIVEGLKFIKSNKENGHWYRQVIKRNGLERRKKCQKSSSSSSFQLTGPGAVSERMGRLRPSTTIPRHWTARARYRGYWRA